MDNEKIKSEMAKVIDDRIQEARRWVGSLNKGMGMWIAEGIVPQGYGHIPTAIKEVQEQITAMLTEYGNEEHELFEQADGEWKSYHCGKLDAIGAISDMLYDLFDEILEEYTAHDD